MKKVFTKEVKLALTALCTIVIIFYGINFLKGIDLFKSYHTYYVNFKDVTGLEESNAVYANGFPIGIVRKINYDYQNPGNIKVTIEVDGNMKFPEGSRAELKSALLGGTTMNVILGESNKMIAPNGSFSGNPQIGLMDKAGEMMPSVEVLLPKIDSILTSLNTLLQDTSLSNIIHNADKITCELNTTTIQLNRIMKEDFPPMMENLQIIGKNAEIITSQLKDINYKQTIEQVNQTITQVQDLTNTLNEKLNSKEGSVGLFLNDREFYAKMTNTLESCNDLLQDLKNHPKRYVHFSVFGKKE